MDCEGLIRELRSVDTERVVDVGGKTCCCHLTVQLASFVNRRHSSFLHREDVAIPGGLFL